MKAGILIAAASVLAAFNCYAQVTSKADLERQYREMCRPDQIASSPHQAANCRLLKAAIEDSSRGTTSSMASENERQYKEMCSPSALAANPGMKSICDSMRPAMEGSRPPANAPRDTGRKPSRVTRCDCDHIVGSCTARVSAQANWLTISSSTPRCSHIQFHVNGAPQATTITGGTDQQEWLGQSPARRIIVESCRICFDNTAP